MTALALAALCPIGMIFVRCAGGLSHSPAESVTEADVRRGDAPARRRPAPSAAGSLRP